MHMYIPQLGRAVPSDTCVNRHKPSLHSSRREERSVHQTVHPASRQHTVEPLIKDTQNKGHLCIKDTFQCTNLYNILPSIYTCTCTYTTFCLQSLYKMIYLNMCLLFRGPTVHTCILYLRVCVCLCCKEHTVRVRIEFAHAYPVPRAGMQCTCGGIL